MAGLRRKSRVLALQSLYEIDNSSHSVDSIISNIREETGMEEESLRFTRELITGVIENRDKIDVAIRKYAPLFPIEQIAAVDRNILRIAIFEILFNNKTPVKVAVNEAVELAKSFGGDTSPKFVNGVLGSIISSKES